MKSVKTPPPVLLFTVALIYPFLFDDKIHLLKKKNDNIKGLLQIKNQIIDFLKNQGVEEIKTVGEKFDLNFMEEVEKVEEERKGYKINGRLLRPAKVKVIK